MNAKQFSWEFMYTGLDNRFETEDVIHSFFIPTFRLKQDDTESDQGGTGNPREGVSFFQYEHPDHGPECQADFPARYHVGHRGQRVGEQDQAVGARHQKPQNEQTDCLWPRHISRMGFVLFINARDVENTAVMKKTRYVIEERFHDPHRDLVDPGKRR